MDHLQKLVEVLKNYPSPIKKRQMSLKYGTLKRIIANVCLYAQGLPSEYAYPPVSV